MRFASRFFVPAILAVLMVASVSQPVAAASGTLDQQQTSIIGGLSLYYESGSSFQFLSQTFTAGLTGILTEVDIAVGWEGNPPNPNGPVTVEIHSGSPGGTLLGSTSLDPLNIPRFFGQAPTEFVAFTFSGVSVVAGSVYAIVMTVSNAKYDPPHYVVADDFSFPPQSPPAWDAYAAGTTYFRDNGGWIDLSTETQNCDIAFKTYVAVPPRTEINSEWTNSPPSIDGVKDSGEWSNLAISFTSPEYPDSYVLPTYVYLMNDASNLYFLVDAVGDTTDSQNDECLLTFKYKAEFPYFEHYARISGDMANGQSTSGNIGFEGKLGFNGHKVYEFAIPLSNINVRPGDAIDFCSPAYGVKAPASMPYDPESNPPRDNVWPQGLQVGNVNSWGILNSRQQSRGADPYHYVGGQMFSGNKLAVLSPYLALISIVAVAAVVVRKKLT